MKRAFKKTEKVVLNNTTSSDDASVEHLSMSLINSKANRRVRTKAAMIGLAISVGATSLLVTRQNDQAQAVDPLNSHRLSSQPPTADDKPVQFAFTVPNSVPLPSVNLPNQPLVFQPTAVSQLPEQETKWQVAAATPLTPVSATKVKQDYGHQLPVPDAQEMPAGVTEAPQELRGQSEAQDQPSTDTTKNLDAQLKAQQEFALKRLQEKYQRLGQSLSQSGSEEATASQTDIDINQAQTTEKSVKISSSQTATEETESLKLGLKPVQQSEREVESVSIPVPNIVNPGMAGNNSSTYEVKPGDTLASIAAKHGTSIAELTKANNLTDPDQLKISQRLVIPRAVQKTVAVSSTRAIATPAPVTNYPLNISSIAPSQLPVPVIVNSPIREAEPSGKQTRQDIEVTEFNNQPSENTSISASSLTENQELEAENTTKDAGMLSLKAEVERLREKYRSQNSAENPEAESASVTIAMAGGSQPLSIPKVETEEENTGVPIAVIQTQQPISIPVPRPDEPVNPEFLNGGKRQFTAPDNSLAASTPNTSDHLGNLRGTEVFPQMNSQLPPLAAVDRYLPQPIEPVIPSGGTTANSFMWPARGVLTSGYGRRWGRMHRGIDIANAVGTPIYASADGVVEKSGWNRGGYGILVDVRHADGSLTRYAHNSRTLVQVGQRVTQGQHIADMGSTGFSTGPHTHFEIHPQGKGATDPIAFLPQERL